MPNVTISVPDDLKIEMDKFPEVSWSEICRNAIGGYIQARKNPTPQIQLMGKEIRPYPHHESGYPGLSINLLIQNNMNFEIVIDRILYNVKFRDEGGNYQVAGSDVDLYKRPIVANSMGGLQFFMKMTENRIMNLNKFFGKTFQCRIECIVFVEGFKTPYRQEVGELKIPIDEWKEFVKTISGEAQFG